MNSTLKKYVKKHYKDYSADLFSVFIWHNINMAKANGYASYMTPVSWMFLKSFEKLRDSVLQLTSIASLIQMETHAYFDEAYVTINTFVLKKATDKTDKVGTYLRLVDFTGGMEVQRQKVTAAIVDPSVNYLYRTNQTNFGKIPGSPIAYWASANLIHDFEVGKPLSEYVDPRQGLATADNNRFLRQWFEVAYSSIKFDARSIEESISSRKKWFPYNKGGAYRKWYGNYDYIVNWENDGYEIKNFKDSNGKVRSRPQNTDYYFREAITWSLITSGGFSTRYREPGSIHDVSGMSAFSNDHNQLMRIMALLNSPVGEHCFKMLNPTINLQVGNVKVFPVLHSAIEAPTWDSLIQNLVKLTKQDWNSEEQRWGFWTLPVLIHIAEHNRNWTVEAAFNQWKQEAQDRFDQLKKNEEELNKIFIDLYGLQDELSPEESDKEVSVRKADLGRDIRAFMSYFIGVTFGRYSLDTPGLAFAGGDWGASKYTSYQPNTDDVIVLTDSDYFGDDRDIMHRFREFLTVTFGEEHLEENFTFIAKALGKAGDTAEDQIRSYLFNDFYKNHLTIYQKRPIYWQLDSGRQGGFKALMYLHRYDGDTMAMIRTSYLHTLQAAYEKRVTTLDTFITSETNTRQKNQLIKQRDHTRKQLEELVKYDAQLQHVANMHIAIDLDDGVVVNHQKVQADVKLLTPIK